MASVFVGVVVLLIIGVLIWDDLVKEWVVWTMLIWFAVFVMMVGQLQKLGVVGWFSHMITNVIDGLGW